MLDQWPYSAAWWPKNAFQMCVFMALYGGVAMTVLVITGGIFGPRSIPGLFVIVLAIAGIAGVFLARHYEEPRPDADELWPYSARWWPTNVPHFFAFGVAVVFVTSVLIFLTTAIFGILSQPVIYVSLVGVGFLLFVSWEFINSLRTPAAPQPAVSTDVKQTLYDALWLDIEANQYNVPPAPIFETILNIGEELYNTVGFPDDRDFVPMRQTLLEAIRQSLSAFLKALPPLDPAPFAIWLPQNSRLIFDLINPFRNERLVGTAFTPADIFQKNVIRITAAANTTKLIYPQDYKGTDMVQQFLRDTPLLKLFQIPIPYRLEPKLRFEHTWIIANSGHGKTQLIQHLLSYDLKDPRASIIVLDSQQQLIDNLAALDLGDRLVLIDPTVAVPSINLFKLGAADANQTLEMYRFMFGSLLDSPMTDNQRTLFDNAALLLAHVPNATFMDFYKLMDGEDYSRYYDKLDPVGRRFFEKDFFTKGTDGYEGNRKQIIRRLNTLMRTYPFTQMFAQSESKIDLEAAMNAGKVILINTSTAKLGREGSKFFGRFFLALIANATTQRQHQSNPIPVYCYVDEADQYAKDDPTIQDLLARARKNNVGLILAHRWLEEMGTTAKALESTASIIFAGGLRAGDLGYMSRVMECDPKLLQGPKLTFGVYQRGKPVVQVNVPPGTLEKMPRLTAQQYEAVKQEQAKKYGVVNAPPPPDIPLVDAT